MKNLAKEKTYLFFQALLLFNFSFFFSLKWTNPSVNYLTLRNFYFFCNQMTVIGATHPINGTYIVAEMDKIPQ